MTVCMHLCRGNFAGAWVAEGGYEPIAESSSTRSISTAISSNTTARAPAGSAAALPAQGQDRGARPRHDQEPQARIQGRAQAPHRRASKHAPLEQLAISPQCGFSSGIGGNTMDVAGEMAKLRLMVETAQEVWGHAAARIATSDRVVVKDASYRSIGRLESDPEKQKVVGEVPCKNKSRRAKRPSRPSPNTR